MNKSPFFSIIVPVYNAETYLGESIESVIAQSFVDWELLLIDDGSSDSSGRICDEYAAKDDRIKCVHKQNGGEFSARKIGLDVSAGRYITGLDSDDCYEVDHLKNIFVAIQKTNADCISFSFRRFGIRSDISDPNALCDCLISGEDFLLKCIRNSDFAFWDKAVRADCYKNVDYSEAPSIRFSEDEIMVIPALCNVVSACVIHDHTYLYRVHDGAVSAKTDFRHIEYIYTAMNYAIKKVQEANLYTGVIEQEYKRYFLHSLNVRVWKLLLSGLWDDTMKDRIMSFPIYDSFALREDLVKFGIKERIRIDLILKRRFDVLEYLASVYRSLRKTKV